MLSHGLASDAVTASDVNKDTSLKTKARTMDLTLKAKNRTKDLSYAHHT